MLFCWDLLSNGGITKTASCNTFFNNRQVVTAGDLGYCPICDLDAPIVPIKPSHVVYSNEKINILEGDYLDCRCAQKPVCVAAGNTFFSVEDDVDPSWYDPALHGHLPRQKVTSNKEGFDDCFKILNEKTGEPVPNVRYALERPDGSREYGVTDAAGNTHTLSPSIGSEFVNLYVEASKS